MANEKLVDADFLDTGLESIAVSIRNKSGTSLKLEFPEEMKKAIDGIATRKPEQEKTVDATKNGPVVVEPDAGNVLTKATVNVDVPVPETQEKEITISENGDYPITPDVGKVLSKVLAKVNVSGGGGGSDQMDKLISGWITEIQSDAPSIRINAFNNCTDLVTASFPKAKFVGAEAFSSCTSLRKVSIPSALRIFQNAFGLAHRLEELRLSVSFFCEAKYDPNINSTCKIYVPASLIEQYKVAPNWSKYAAQFVAIEEV